MAAHNEGLPDFDGFFNDEWVDEQIEEISIAFCDENGIEIVSGSAHQSAKSRERKGKKLMPKQQGTKPSKGEEGKELQLVLSQIPDLVKETFCSMESDEMIYLMYQDDLQRLKAIDNYPLQEAIKSRFFATCKDMSILKGISPKAKETMWVKFNEIWQDEAFTESVQKSFGITKDLCSWFLFMLQQTIAKKFIADKKPNDTIIKLSNDEMDTVTYICGSILKKLTTKFFDLKRKTRAEIHPFLQKQIDIIDACKEETAVASASTNNKLIDTLSRGGLVHPKKKFANIIFKVESIFRVSVSKLSRSINKEEILGKCFEESSISEQFFLMTESVTAADEQKYQLLKSCIELYIKIRSFGHAKNTIEDYYSQTQTEKKQKALRREIKKKSDEKTKATTKKQKS